MKVQSYNNTYFNVKNCDLKSKCKNSISSSKNNYSTYSQNFYKKLSPSFKATNVELISKMQIALKENKPSEMMKFFEQMSDTAQNNVRGFVEKFKANGLNLNNYVITCASCPTLFGQRHETMGPKVKGVMENFGKYGLTPEDCLYIYSKNPSLLTIRFETIKNHVKDVVEEFEPNGLTMKAYIPLFKKCPPVPTQSPVTIKNNVNGVIDEFKSKGLTADIYIPICIKQPSLFTRSQKTVAEHINIIRLSRYNSNKDIDNENFWKHVNTQAVEVVSSSGLLMTQGLIVPKMFEGATIPKELRGRKLKQKLEVYLKEHPNDKYVLNIKNIPGETGHIERLQEYLKTLTEDLNLPKDMFKVNRLS